MTMDRHPLGWLARLLYILEALGNYAVGIATLVEPAQVLPILCPLISSTDPMLTRPEITYLARMLGIMLTLGATTMFWVSLCRHRATLLALCCGLLFVDVSCTTLAYTYLGSRLPDPSIAVALAMFVLYLLLRVYSIFAVLFSSSKQREKSH